MKFFAIGTPAPQGSKRHVGNGIMVESSKAVAPWREAVAAQAAQAFRGKGYLAPSVTLRFVLSPPKYVVTDMQRPAERQKLAPWHHTKKPDLDKLVRSTFDALKIGGVITDDSNIIAVTAVKVYALPGEPTGCEIEIREATR